MKSRLFLPIALVCAVSLTFFLTSCNQEPPIVEEDLNGFDARPADFQQVKVSQEAIKQASLIQNDEDVLNQHIEGWKIMKSPNEENMHVVYPENMPMEQVLESLKPAEQRTKRSVANPKMIFDNTPGTQGIMIRKNPQGGYCGMGNFTGGVTFVLDANPFSCAGELYLCTDLRMDWRQVVYVSGCNTSKLRYINSSGALTDTDYMSREGYNWLYMRCSSELASHADIRQGQCGNSYSGKFCDES